MRIYLPRISLLYILVSRGLVLNKWFTANAGRGLIVTIETRKGSSALGALLSSLCDVNTDSWNNAWTTYVTLFLMHTPPLSKSVLLIRREMNTDIKTKSIKCILINNQFFKNKQTVNFRDIFTVAKSRLSIYYNFLSLLFNLWALI